MREQFEAVVEAGVGASITLTSQSFGHLKTETRTVTLLVDSKPDPWVCLDDRTSLRWSKGGLVGPHIGHWKGGVPLAPLVKVEVNP